MSMQAALQFIQQARTDEALQNQIEKDVLNTTLDDLVELGREAGFTVTPGELRAAFKHDWAMRWLRYNDSTT